MRKLILLPLAGALVIGGASAVMAAPTAIEQSVGQVTRAATAAGSFLSEVLSELVGEGVINQDQADAVIDAVDARREEHRSRMQAQRELIASLFEDGAITTEELEQLPADHPWRSLDELFDDGQLTLDELRSIAGPFGPGRGPRGGGFGHGGHGSFGERGPGPWFGEPRPDSDEQQESQPGS